MNCYIVCGGRSSRMGRPKASLVAGEKTFLERVAGAAEHVFDEVVIVTKRGSPPITTGLRVLFDDESSERVAPIFGVRRALEDAGKAGAWVLAVDYPLMTSDFLSYCHDRADFKRYDLIVPRWDEKFQMLCAGYGTSLIEKLRSKIELGDLQLRDLVGDDRTLVIREDEIASRFDAPSLFNVNTPAELERALSLAASRGEPS